MKTIAYVLADFPALSETFIGNEIRAVQAQGHRALPMIMHRSAGPAQPEDVRLAAESPALADISWKRVLRTAFRPSRSALQALKFAWTQRGLHLRTLIANALKIASFARDNNCTHIHAHFAGGATAHAIVAARWIGATVSFVGHGHDIYAEPEDLVAKLANVDFAIASCEDMAGDFRSLCPAAEVARVSCGTDPERFAPSIEEDHNGRFLLIGRLVGQKGIDDLLCAMARLPDSIAVDIVGEGPMRGELHGLAQELGLSASRVRWLGARPASWIAEHGPQYLALVAPFKPALDGQRDSGPVVIKEAMAMGLPVIGTRFMGTKEMITRACGRLYEPGDIDALVRAMKEIAALSPWERRNMGYDARHRVETQFSLRHQAQRISALVEAA